MDNLFHCDLGSGVKRAIEHWPDIAFVNDVDGCLFTAIVRRTGATNISPDGEDGNGHPLAVKGHAPTLSGQIAALSGLHYPVNPPRYQVILTH